jgi:uncharacterized membrane protein
MIAERYLRRWTAAGLIDAATAGRIGAWERAHARPLGLWAMAGLGAIAIGLGVMAVVGANWEDIPHWLKLAVCFVLQVVLAGAVWHAASRGWVWTRELAALLLFALVLAGIALVGQVYQLQSAPWRALVLWLVLTTPFMAVATRTVLSGIVWGLAAAVAWFAAWDPLSDALRLAIGGAGPGSWYDAWPVWYTLTYLPAPLMVAIGAWRRMWPGARAQGQAILAVALLGSVAAASAVVSFDVGSHDSFSLIRLAALVVLATVLAAWAAFATADDPQPWRVPAMLGATTLVWLIGMSLVRVADLGPHSLELTLRAAVFVAFWAFLAWLAAREGRRGWLAVCVTVIGLRLLIVYFEAIGGLTATGLALIGGGVLLIVLAAVGWTLVRRLAPPAPAAAGAGS